MAASASSRRCRPLKQLKGNKQLKINKQPEVLQRAAVAAVKTSTVAAAKAAGTAKVAGTAKAAATAMDAASAADDLGHGGHQSKPRRADNTTGGRGSRRSSSTSEYGRANPKLSTDELMGRMSLQTPMVVVEPLRRVRTPSMERSTKLLAV